MRTINTDFCVRRYVLGRVVRAAGLSAVAGAALAAVSGSAVAAHSSACLMRGLTVSVINPSGAAGHINYDLRLKNISGHSCTVRGYPGVVAVNAAGRHLGSPAGHGIGSVRTVTLRPGHHADAPLSITEAGNYPAARCRMTRASGLRVTLGGSKTARLNFEACTVRGVSYLSVAPLA